jgi:hypothetical protein
LLTETQVDELLGEDWFDDPNKTTKTVEEINLEFIAFEAYILFYEKYNIYAASVDSNCRYSSDFGEIKKYFLEETRRQLLKEIEKIKG